MAASLDQIAGVALSSVETLRTTYDIARLAIERGVPGDFVEAGVFAGAQCAAMAKALVDFYHGDNSESYYPTALDEARQTGRRVHLFDSFTGIPQATQEDIEWLEAKHPVGHSACSLEQVQRNMKTWGIDESLLVYHPGMFSETMSLIDSAAHRPKSAYIQSIAVLRLDADLYESTKTALEYLYPLVSPGGWIICDDWDLSGSRQAVNEYVGQAFGPVYWQRQRYNIG